MSNSWKAESRKYCEQFRVKSGEKIRLKDVDPALGDPRHDKKSAKRTVNKLQKRMEDLQGQLYAEGKD